MPGLQGKIVWFRSILKTKSRLILTLPKPKWAECPFSWTLLRGVGSKAERESLSVQNPVPWEPCPVLYLDANT